MPRTNLMRPPAEVEVRKVLNQKEAMRYLEVNYRTFKRIIESGELPYRECGKQLLFSRITLDRWLDYQPEKERGCPT